MNFGRSLVNTFHLSSFLRFIFRFVLWILLGGCFWINGSDAAQCFYTTKQTARDQRSGICESSHCLVGMKGDNQLIQTCATESAKVLLECTRNLKDWVQICSCNFDHCNTIYYLQGKIEKYDAYIKDHPEAANKFADLDVSTLEDKDIKKGSYSPNKQLIVLLVVVPLGIGAVTVCLVFLNYHCKMC